MNRIAIAFCLFLLQLRLVFKEGDFLFNKYSNPVLLFIVSMAIPGYLIWLSLRQPVSTAKQKTTSPWKRLLWASTGMITILLSYEELRKIFVQYSDPGKYSDVLPQLLTLYQRFAQADFPYTPIHFDTYDLIPIYMPLHWLPAGIAVLFSMDVRWVGFIFLALALAVYGGFFAEIPGRTWIKTGVVFFPSLVLWAFIQWGKIDLAVSFELIIAAYYLVLAGGLVFKRYWLVAVGIILCLLSRYTFLFWLPLYAIIYFLEKGWKQSFLLWGIVAVVFCLIYVLPFYLKDPEMVPRQFAYYTQATVADWVGCCADPPVSWTQEKGISFAVIMKALFSGDMAHRVAMNKMVLGIALLLTYLGIFLGYRHWHRKIDSFTFSLLSLYTFLTVYFFFCPLTFRYYLLPWLMVSAALCGKIILREPLPVQR